MKKSTFKHSYFRITAFTYSHIIFDNRKICKLAIIFRVFLIFITLSKRYIVAFFTILVYSIVRMGTNIFCIALR